MKHNKNLIILLGAEKCGTTWLYKLFLTHPNYIDNKFFWKELQAWHCYKTTNIIQKIKRSKNFLQFIMFINPKYFYFKYFNMILKNNLFTSDLSPSNIILEKKDIFYIKQKFNKLNISVKFILFVRDPVQRCLSSFNMYYKKNQKTGLFNDRIIKSSSLEEKFIFFYKLGSCQLSTKYEQILSQTQILNQDDLRVFIYEDFFFNHKIKLLNDFLGVDFDTQFTKQIIFSQKQDFVFDTSILNDCALFYKDTYNFMSNKFPEVVNMWDGYKYLNN